MEYDQPQDYPIEEEQGYYAYSDGDGQGIMNIQQGYPQMQPPPENLVQGQPKKSMYSSFASYIGGMLESMQPDSVMNSMKNINDILLKYQAINAQQFEPPQ